MKFLLKISLLILLSTTFVFSQEQSRLQKIKEWKRVSLQIKQTKNPSQKLQERWQKLMEEILSVSDSDVAESKRIGAKALRMIPNGIADSLTTEVGSPSFYSLSETSEYFSPELEYKNKSFILQRSGLNHAFITDIDKVLLEKINEQSREVVAINKYQSPIEAKNIKTEFVSDGIVFSTRVTVYVEHTYLIRNVMYPDGGEVFVVKVHRKDTDGSIIIFIKKLKSFEMSKPTTFPIQETSIKPAIVDEKLVVKVTKALRTQGFKNIQIEIAGQFLVLKGIVPRGKLAEAVKLAIEIANVPIKNQLTEQ